VHAIPLLCSVSIVAGAPATCLIYPALRLIDTTLAPLRKPSR